jgi:hypothetical protein
LIDPDATLVKKFTQNNADIGDVLLANKFFKKIDSRALTRVREYKDAVDNSDDKSHPFTTNKKGIRADSAHRATEDSVKAFAPEATRVTTDARAVSESFREERAQTESKRRKQKR